MAKLLKILAILLLCIVVLIVCRDFVLISSIKIFYEKEYKGDKLAYPQISDSLKNELSQYICDNHQSPETYIVSKFQDHDIIFLGEYHRFKHDVELIHLLIPLLYESGILNLGLEFACSKDQSLIDSVLYQDDYNEEIIKKVLFEWNILWGYQEYADIFRTAWELNKSISNGDKKFRIVGLNIPQFQGNDDDAMETTIVKEFLATNEKALIYCGGHHAFTSYQFPILENGKFSYFFDRRVGNLIHKRIQDRAITILLHSPWRTINSSHYPVNGIIDTVMTAIPEKYRRCGFDTKESPFGDLPDYNSIYQYGYDEFTLKDMCDGYIYQKPFSEYVGVRSIDKFITRQNIQEARLRFHDNGFKFLFDYFNTAFWNYAISMDADLKHMHKFSMYK